MISYDGGDPARIQHFIKVYTFAVMIGEGEQLPEETMEILRAAALVHDIGIKVAEEKYGSSDGKLQEKEGPPVAPADADGDRLSAGGRGSRVLSGRTSSYLFRYGRHGLSDSRRGQISS